MPGNDTVDVAAAKAAIESVAAALRGHNYRYDDEHDLQRGLTSVLLTAGRPVQREVLLSASSRLDLLVGRVGIEVKVAGDADHLARQVARYAASPFLDGLLVVTTRSRHLAIPRLACGKPVGVFLIRGALL